MIDSPSASNSPQADPPQKAVRVSLPQSAPYVTYALIGITVLFYILQILSVALFGYPVSFTQMDWLELYGARINEFIEAGQIWRLITPALLHGSIMHISSICMRCFPWALTWKDISVIGVFCCYMC